MSFKNALIFATNGCEETELLITSNILRRGGVNVTFNFRFYYKFR